MRTAARYLNAVVLTAIAIAITAELRDFLAPMQLFFLWCAVLLTAILSGFWPAMLATALSLLGATLFVFAPRGTVVLQSPRDLLRLTLFALFAGGISVIAARVRHAEERLRRSERRYRTLAEASLVLGSSLDYERTLGELARLCVPAVADACAVDLLRDGKAERLVIEPAGAAIEDGIAAPMVANGRTLGTLTLSGRRFSSSDIPLAEELARRAAAAVENARLYEAAEAANRAKDEFLATLSHELRTPLTAIAGWADMLDLGLSDESTRRVAIDTIQKSAKAQGELIDDLLDIARVVAGTLHLHVADVDLTRVVQETAVAVKPAADAKRIALAVLAPPSALIVRGEERRLRQIAWNLVSNAVKFTDQGSVRIELSSRGANACLTVIDSGRGIDPAFLPYAFDRFRQADSTHSRQHGGLGLGLAVVRHLVELHGGTVRGESAGTGRGATFTVELPLARGDDRE